MIKSNGSKSQLKIPLSSPSSQGSINPNISIQKYENLVTKLSEYENRQKKWKQEKETLVKSINILKLQLNKTKQINNQLMKKCKHKRTSSEEQTFIFNQTNISSYYPLIGLSLKSNINWSLKNTVKAHLDSIRVIKMKSSQNSGSSLIFSGGDDSILKVWQKDNFVSSTRQHLGPIYTICTYGNSILTGGAEGVIRQFQYNEKEKKLKFKQDLQAHQDSIWEICGIEETFVTSSSDKSHKIIKLKSEQGNCLEQKSSIKLVDKTPTSITFLHKNQFISGYCQTNSLFIYDIEKNCQVVKTYQYQSKQNYSQPNKICFNIQNQIIGSAHEDHHLRFFDIRTNHLIKSFVAHSDAVTSMCFTKDTEVMSVGHDGSFRIWDLRQYRCIGDIAVHMKKYDESALSMNYLSPNTVAVGGADGSFKLFQPEH